MSERDPRDTPPDPAEEPFLGRWSRLKTEARRHEAHPTPEPEAPRHDATPAAVAGTPAVDAPPAVELPDLDRLDQDSDYSAFLAPGVDAALKRRALRKLFHSPKFNVFDGLDTYRDDFTSFPALGSIVTADMRYQLERAARELAARAEDAISRDAPAAEAPPPAVTQEPPPAPADTSTARNDDDAEHGPA